VFSQGTRQLIRTVLAVSIALLVTMSTACEIARLGFGYDTLFGLARLFALGQEANVPTWFTSATLLVASLLAGAVALIKRHDKERLARYWALLSVMLCLMSLDETAVIHEIFSARAAQVVFSVQGEPWFVYYAWIVPGAIVLGLMIVWFSTLWRSLGPMRSRFTRAAALYFGGALGTEVAEAVSAAAFGMERAFDSPIYSAIWTTQELLEMAGVAALILALLDYLALNHGSLAVELTPPELPKPRPAQRVSPSQVRSGAPERR
jgi:hypothetical protein